MNRRQRRAHEALERHAKRIEHTTNDPGIMVAMLERCGKCGFDGRIQGTCGDSKLTDELHAEVVEAFGPEHMHLFCPACGQEGIVGPPQFGDSETSP